jgi:quercetin dioxygenase-like cupin family protein
MTENPRLPAQTDSTPRAVGTHGLSSNPAATATSFDETVREVFRRDIPNIPGRSLVAVMVTYPPGGASPVHRHAPSAFIFAFVLSGAVRSQVGEQRPLTYHPGECFYEDPGSHHLVSENASDTDAASMLAVFIVDPSEDALTVADPH